LIASFTVAVDLLSLAQAEVVEAPVEGDASGLVVMDLAPTARVSTSAVLLI
jgi:hypothetical protein